MQYGSRTRGYGREWYGSAWTRAISGRALSETEMGKTLFLALSPGRAAPSLLLLSLTDYVLPPSRPRCHRRPPLPPRSSVSPATSHFLRASSSDQPVILFPSRSPEVLFLLRLTLTLPLSYLFESLYPTPSLAENHRLSGLPTVTVSKHRGVREFVGRWI